MPGSSGINGITNGHDGGVHPFQIETSDLLQPLLSKLADFQQKADDERNVHEKHESISDSGTALLPPISLNPEKLAENIYKSLEISEKGIGAEGLNKTVQDILDYSVNPTAPGFLDKLYAAPLPPGIAAELVLAYLNSNLHVYQVSPVLTLIEKKVSKALAALFGFATPRAGGISVQGGSASNLTSIVVARNTLFPHTKTHGNASENGGRLILFTSAHGHYSIEKAAQALGFGSSNVVSVPVDGEGRMIAVELDRLIEESKRKGETPFYVSATAGTTVLGSFDPFDDIAEVARKHRCWFHIDGSWGGSFIFSGREDTRRNLKGVEKADSIAINPHKMLGVPVTCSFLLTRDLKLFQAAMTLRAGYLFHDVEDDDNDHQPVQTGADDETCEVKHVNGEADQAINPAEPHKDLFDSQNDEDESWTEPNDLADLTLQCGRRGDSLKFFLSWQYYGTSGYREKIDKAYNLALYLSDLVSQSSDLTLILPKSSKPQCLQVCFNYTPQGKSPFGTVGSKGIFKLPSASASSKQPSFPSAAAIGKYNTQVTAKITKALITKGFMIDFAPALEGSEDKGSFFRVVLNISTIRQTVERLVEDIVEVGASVMKGMEGRYELI